MNIFESGSHSQIRKPGAERRPDAPFLLKSHSPQQAGPLAAQEALTTGADAVRSARALVAASPAIPGSVRDVDGDGRLTGVDIDAFAKGGGSFASPAQLAAALVATGASRFVLGENHDSPHPELVVATILAVRAQRGQAPVVFHESYGGPFQGLVDDLHEGKLNDREFAQRYLSLMDTLSGGAKTEYARKIYIPQLLAYHQAGARIVLLDELELASNRDAAWKERYAADQAANRDAVAIFVVGGVHSQRVPSIFDADFPENDFDRPFGMRMEQRYGPGATLNIYVSNSPNDAMAAIYEPSFSSWDAVLAMPRDASPASGEAGAIEWALPADEDGVPLLSPEALGARWHSQSPQMKGLPKSAAPLDRGARAALSYHGIYK